jgi:uncharacterized protein YecE (DUF72 family)
MTHDEQHSLFGPDVNAVPGAPPDAAHVALAARLPRAVRFGTASWSYPGWAGLVYGGIFTPKDLSRHGLRAYASHPLLSAVEVDRTYYDPLAATELGKLAGQVPDGFRFVAKAHEDCVLATYPPHARYGKRAGLPNPRYLDASYATDAVVGPFLEGFGPKGGAILFQFPPGRADDPRAFADALFAFLSRLPKGPVYAIELRTPSLFTRAYCAAIAEAGAQHCHNAWSAMPSVIDQAKAVAPSARRPIVVRWMLRRGDQYESARDRYSPFDRLVDEDVATRGQIATLVARGHAHGVDALVVVDNKAEGSAPASIVRLAEAVASRLTPPRLSEP